MQWYQCAGAAGHTSGALTRAATWAFRGTFALPFAGLSAVTVGLVVDGPNPVVNVVMLDVGRPQASYIKRQTCRPSATLCR